MTSETSWWRRKPSPIVQQTEHATAKLEHERRRRKSAFERLIRAIDDIPPIDRALEAIADDVRRRPPK